jgi:lipopolysaccharide/colanic/teichoic acid biosynthesis glycosyltransferase
MANRSLIVVESDTEVISEYRPGLGSRHRAVRRTGYEFGKRALDIVVSVAVLLLSSPLMLAAWVAIRLETPGPAIFKQARVGLKGREFTLLKFRGMWVDAKERFPELYQYQFRSDEVAGVQFHPDHDPRVTRVGRFLRKTSIDELPNLINVLIGDISLVGPRPEIPEMLPYYGEAAETLLSVKPGVTSLAKVSGRDELSFGATLDFDLRYVAERDLWLDLRIMALTIVTVCRQEGVR